ncbi:MAG: hypothetical protein WBO07_07830 [Formosimonas sp.]
MSKKKTGVKAFFDALNILVGGAKSEAEIDQETLTMACEFVGVESSLEAIEQVRLITMLSRFYVIHGQNIASQRGITELGREIHDLQGEIIEVRNATIEVLKNKPIDTARKAARALHAKGAKGKAKVQIKTMWLDWQANKHKFESAAQFAVYCMMNVKAENGAQIFETSGQIERWCTQWKKEQNNTASA